MRERFRAGTFEANLLDDAFWSGPALMSMSSLSLTIVLSGRGESRMEACRGFELGAGVLRVGSLDATGDIPGTLAMTSLSMLLCLSRCFSNVCDSLCEWFSYIHNTYT